MTDPKFIHLRVHSEYSMVDGLVKVKPFINTLTANHMPAAAITDQTNLFAMVKFYRAAQSAGIKPIIGADLLLYPHASTSSAARAINMGATDEKKPYRLTLLCQNQTGYRHLTRLISRAYLEGQETGVPTLRREWLTPDDVTGLIALSGALEGDIGQALLNHQSSLAIQYADYWKNLFPERFYLELQRIGREQENTYLEQALVLAEKLDLPVVATNDVRFLHRDDFEAHEARICVHQGWTLSDPRRPRPYTEQQYLRSPEEMLALFADIPSALKNSVEIAKRCNVELALGKSFLPNFPVPVDMTVDNFFQKEAESGLEKRWGTLVKNFPIEQQTEQKQRYQERLQLEISVIRNMGFTGYFLIVADFIRWAKTQQIFVGPGRGSGAGSLVAYALEITDLDPIAQDLLFERFLNPERVSMADFDIDFCMEGRDRVIDYVTEKYGRESVAQIITYGTMAARAVVRDVGRVLGFPYGFVDKIAKLIPFELGMTLKKALEDEALLLQRYEQEAEVKNLIDLAMKLEGAPRNVGKHAGGVVIAPSILTDFTPLYCEAGSQDRVTQFDKDDVEAVGLVKFDFLGLRTLTIMDWALQAINHKRQKQGEAPIHIHQVPLNDPATFDLLKSAQTTAVFQLESRGIKELVKRLQPECFNDIVPLVALFRPGPLQSGMVEDFLNRRHGKASVVYPHPLLEPILRPTYGVILYQEQVMQIAQILAGFTLGSADILRRAMGKKKAEEMAKQRAIFVSGAQEKGVDGKIANEIFNLMEMFADYGFNKSHSAAYALLSYQTAWLKAHYPAEFMAAVLSSDMDHTDKVVKFLEDCLLFQLNIVPPNLNQSDYRFTVCGDKEILYGLGAIKGVGETAVQNLMEERQRRGLFKSLFDLCQRVDTRKVNRKALEALIRSGAMDTFGIERSCLMNSIDLALQASEQHQRANKMGQMDLFTDMPTHEEPMNSIAYATVPPWTEEQRLAGEKETLGWYLSGHPIAQYESELSCLITAPIAKLSANHRKTLVTAGFVTQIRTLQTKSGGRIAFLTLQDRTGHIEVAVFTQLYEMTRDRLLKDQLLVIEGELSVDEVTGDHKITARSVYDLTQMREKFVRHLLLHLPASLIKPDFIPLLKQILTPFRGGLCPVIIHYEQEHASAKIQLGEAWRIKPHHQLIEKLTQLCGNERVSLSYKDDILTGQSHKG